VHIAGIDTAVFMKQAFEPCLIGLLLVCLVHSWFTHGPARTLREFTAGFFLTACCESVGVLSGAYVYPGFRWYVLATPVANPASWIATVYIVIEVTNRLVYGRRSLAPCGAGGRPPDPEAFRLFPGSLLKTVAVLAALDAALAVAVDLVLDPLATVYNWWVWVPCEPGVTAVGPGDVDPYNFSRLVFMQTPANPIHGFFARFFPHGMRYPTRVLGIPLINFVAWFVFVWVFTSQFRFVELQGRWGPLKKTLVLWGLVLADIPVLAFVLITPNL